MKQNRLTEAEVRVLIKLLMKTELYETNKGARNYIEIISGKLEK